MAQYLNWKEVPSGVPKGYVLGLCNKKLHTSLVATKGQKGKEKRVSPFKDHTSAALNN